MRKPIFAISSGVGKGKTSWLINLIKLAKTEAFEVSGILQEAIYEGEIRRAYDLVHIPSGEKRRLATRSELCGFDFDENVFSWASSVLKPSPNSIWCIDELGLLEERALGHWPRVREGLEESQFSLAIFSIRESSFKEISRRCGGFVQVFSPSDCVEAAWEVLKKEALFLHSRN